MHRNRGHSSQGTNTLINNSKKLITKLSEAQTKDKDLLGHLMLVAKEVAKKMNINDAFNIVINNGRDAGQTVFHLHIQLLAGKNFSDFLPG